jgi:alpha-ribazole phosphatase
MGPCHSVDLYLVRHGITLWNVQKKYLGHTDIGLVESEKSQLCGLRGEMSKLTFDYFFSSDLLRCQETAAYIKPEVSFQLEKRVRELNFGEWEGKTYDQLKHDIRYTNWLDDWEELGPPNGETGIQFKARVDQFLTELLQRIEKMGTKGGRVPKVLIITHGGVIRHILSRCISGRSFWQWKITYGKGYRLSLDWQEGEWRCNSWSEVPIQEKEG